jgi:V8-like Glu-specific endopeptidase
MDRIQPSSSQRVPGTVYLGSRPPIIPFRTERTAMIDISGVPASAFTNERVLMRIVKGRDGREKIPRPDNWPYSVHGRLFMKMNGENHVGSGTLIGPRFVLTAAHNIYSHDHTREFDIRDMEFVPGMNGFSAPWGRIRIVERCYPNEYRTNKKEDYAILVLERDIGDHIGMFGLKAHNRADVDDKACKIYGYPLSIDNQPPNHHCLWGMEGRVKVDNMGDLMYYEIDTSGGQSGSAIWYNEGDKYYIVGVHVLGSNNYNAGTFLNGNRLQRILDWIRPYYNRILTTILQERDAKVILQKMQEAQAGLFVRSLNLQGKELGPEEVLQLSHANLINMTSLDLSNNWIRSEGVATLSQASFPNLTSLNLSSNFIVQRGAIALSNGKLTSLTSLDLSWNSIDDRGAVALISEVFRNLTTLNLTGNSISPGVIKKLRDRFREIII